MPDKADSGVLGQGHMGLFRFGAGYNPFEGLAQGLQVAAWRFGTILGAAGVVKPFYWDITKWDEQNWDVTATGGATGVTETVPVFFVTSATVIIPSTTQRSGQPTGTITVQ